MWSTSLCPVEIKTARSKQQHHLGCNQACLRAVATICCFFFFFKFYHLLKTCIVFNLVYR